ncbi:ATP-binding protein [Pseudomonadota bacterium]
MGKRKISHTPKPSFGRQIILLITFAIVSLAVMGSITAAYFINNRISDIVVDQGRQITAALAHQSILPLLSGVPDSAEKDVNATLQYPNIEAIIIYDKSGELLINTGYEETHDVKEFPQNTAPFSAELLLETENSWEFMATVYDVDVDSGGEPTLDNLFIHTPELLGYVVVQADKSNLYKIQGQLLLDSLYIFLGVAISMLAVSILVSQQMTTPLDVLAKLMKKAEDGEEGIRSEPNGPLEIYNMARAFNTMMDALEQRQTYAEEQHQSLLREISERQVIEQNLRDSETNLVSIFNNVVDGIIILDDQGLIETANPSAEKILQYPVELIQGRNFIELMNSLNDFDEILSVDLLKLTGASTGKEHFSISNSGNTTHLDLKFSQMFVKGVNKFIVILIDVTVSQRQKNKIQSLLFQHETVVSNVPGIIVELDSNNRLVWWNKYTEKVTGLDGHLLKNMDFIRLLPHDQKDETVEGLASVRREGRGELHADIMASAGPIPYQLNASAIHSEEGGSFSVLVVGLDDSQSVLAQNALKEARDAALESARVKSEFLANMSHEIRTPMNGMFGMLQLLTDSELNTEQRGYADIALRSSEQLLNIINDILDFSKIEAGKLELEHIEFSPRNAIEDISELFMHKCHFKNVQMFSKVDLDVPDLIMGDPTKINQVISNLVGNAVKFTDKGHIYVYCHLSRCDSDLVNKKLVIEVEDTGIGIEQDAQRSIFDSFIQVDGSSTRRYSGTGLGLAIVRQLVELMGGTIKLDSTLGEGSRFSVILPIEAPVGLPVVASVSRSKRPQRALYIGHNKIIDSILAEYTKPYGYSVATVPPDEQYVAEFISTCNLGMCNDFLIFIEHKDVTEGLIKAMSVACPPASNIKLCLIVTKKGLSDIELPRRMTLMELALPLTYSKVVECMEEYSTTTTLKKAIVEEEVPAEEPSKPSRVLIVEDNETNLRVILSMLGKSGYDGDVAKNGKEALAMIEAMEYELVFMDCQMPVMDGYQATKAVREKEAKGDIPYHTRIIAMTGNALDGDRERCIEAGMDDYMAKPVRFSLLKETMAKWLG